MLYIVDKKYYDLLKLDKEFLQKESRPYFVIIKLNYRGEAINAAVPLRSNINPDLQKNPEEHLFTPPTKNTRIGNLAGFHLTKIVPFVGSFFSIAQKITSGARIADDIAKRNILVLSERCQKILDRFAAGERIPGAIDFDAALSKLNLLQSHTTSPPSQSRRVLATQQAPTQEQLDVAKKHGFSAVAAERLLAQARAGTLAEPLEKDQPKTQKKNEPTKTR